MKKSRYKRKCGDFEIRVTADGRVIMLAPDEELLQVAEALEPGNELLSPVKEKKKNAGK